MKLAILFALVAAAPALAAGPADPDTRAWWELTGHLSSDAFEGRDTGSAGHARAAEHIAGLFARAGLAPLGDAGGYRQRVPLHEVAVDKAGTRFAIVGPRGRAVPLRFLHDIGVRATAALPRRIDAALAFRGYCSAAEIGSDVAGKVVVCFGGRRSGMPGGARITAAAAAAGAAGVLVVDDIGFTIEPPRWPIAYARSVAIAGSPPPPAPAVAVMRLKAEALRIVLAGSDQDAKAILADAVAARPLPRFDPPARLVAELAVSERDYASDNIVAVLPGSDPALAGEAVVVSAHIDGYGFGEPVAGDGLYNGAFDDAAYVATLVRLAVRRQGKPLRRPLVFAVFTAEEKGLLGAQWFVAHPPVARDRIAANINLDAVRPLFPLTILTLIGSDRSTLKADVEAVAAPLNIAVRPDREPERGMIGRTDASAFLAAGIPAVSFMFGYDPGSAEEARFRTWYRTRYHKPQDDIGQPIDFSAAADFNRFFYALVERVGDGAGRPVIVK